MKLIPVVYYGFTGLDRRFSSPMLPWIVSEIKRRHFAEKISLGVEEGVLQAYNPDFELQFSHKVNQISRFSQADQDPTTFLYLMKDDSDVIVYCYLFQAQKVADVLHAIDEILDPNIANLNITTTALDFLKHSHKWNINDYETFSFFLTIKEHRLEKYYGESGQYHTFFIPIDGTYQVKTIDDSIIEGHIIPNKVLFTRPAHKGLIYETRADGDYVCIVLTIDEKDGKYFVKSYTVLGDVNHPKGETVAEIIKPNIPVANGVVHLISKPLGVFKRELKPFPYLSVYYKVSSDPYLNISYTYGEHSVNHVLKDSTAMYTYFIPKDSAWLRGDIQENPKLILQRHLIKSPHQRYTLEKLQFLTAENNGTVVLESFAGDIELGVNGTNLIWQGREIRILRPDYECSDGIVHIVDGLFTGPFVRNKGPAAQGGFWQFLKKLVG